MNRVPFVAAWLAVGCLLASPLVAYVLGAGLGLAVFVASLPCALAGVIGNLWLWWRHRDPRAAWALVFAVLPLVVASLVAAKGAGQPMINDVSTDLANPPALRVVGQDIAFPENSRRELVRNGPKPWLVNAPVEEVQRAVAAAIAARKDWEVGQAQPGRIAFVATTRIFRFKDDVVVRIREAPGGTRVDVRSRSRMGKGDLGANAKRINQLLEAARALVPE